MPGQGMARMVQMITALAEMQDRRRKLALEEDTFDEQKKQFATQMGFNEKGQRQAAALKLIDAISTGGIDAHTAAPKFAQLMGFDQNEAQVFMDAAPNATTAIQQFNLRQQQEGLKNMGNPNANPQQNAQQAAYLAQQANTSPGGLATSNLQARMANTPISPDMAQRAGEGYVMRQATGQDPFAFNVGQAGIDQNLAPQAAAIGAGTAPSWMNKEQAKYWMGSLKNDADGQAARTAAAQAGQGVDMGSYASLMNAAHAIAKDMAEGKYANENLKVHMMAQYNNMARMLGLPPMTDKNAPDKTGAVKQGINKIGGMDIPAAGQRPPAVNPMYRQPNFY